MTCLVSGRIPDRSQRCGTLNWPPGCIADVLRDAGHHVIEACDADEALSILKAAEPDLTISDVRMPGTMDGLVCSG